jgi:hypothetical protein
LSCDYAYCVEIADWLCLVASQGGKQGGKQGGCNKAQPKTKTMDISERGAEVFVVEVLSPWWFRTNVKKN